MRSYKWRAILGTAVSHCLYLGTTQARIHDASDFLACLSSGPLIEVQELKIRNVDSGPDLLLAFSIRRGAVYYVTGDPTFWQTAKVGLDKCLACVESLEKQIASLEPMQKALLQRSMWELFDALWEVHDEFPRLDQNLVTIQMQRSKKLLGKLALTKLELRQVDKVALSAFERMREQWTTKWRLLPGGNEILSRYQLSVHAQEQMYRSAFDSTYFLAKLKSVDAPCEIYGAFALARRAILIDERSNLARTDLVESLTLRKATRASCTEPVDRYAEAILDPQSVFKGNGIQYVFQEGNTTEWSGFSAGTPDLWCCVSNLKAESLQSACARCHEAGGRPVTVGGIRGLPEPTMQGGSEVKGVIVAKLQHRSFRFLMEGL